MRVLLDTQALIWAVDDPAKPGANAEMTLKGPANDLLVSAASLWELAIKVGLGRLTLSLPYRTWMNRALSDLGATVLPVTVEYADIQSTLPYHHRDPFDRLLIAQAVVEGLEIVSSDIQLDAYGVGRLW